MQITEQEQCSSIGRLMSPHEVYAATLSRSDIPNDVKHEWFLCGDVPENIWDTLRDSDDEVVFRLTAFTTQHKTGYVCFTTQVEQSQIRFVLPIGGKKVEWFLKEACLCGVYLSMSRCNSDSAMVRKFGIEPSQVTPVLDIAKRCEDLCGEDLVIDFGLAVTEFRKLSTVPSIFQESEVSDSHVIAVWPN